MNGKNFLFAAIIILVSVILTMLVNKYYHPNKVTNLDATLKQKDAEILYLNKQKSDLVFAESKLRDSLSISERKTDSLAIELKKYQAYITKLNRDKNENHLRIDTMLNNEMSRFLSSHGIKSSIIAR